MKAWGQQGAHCWGKDENSLKPRLLLLSEVMTLPVVTLEVMYLQHRDTLPLVMPLTQLFSCCKTR